MPDFFEPLIGRWNLIGEIMGKALEQKVVVDRVLGGQYVRIHYLPSTATPLTNEPYECISFVGFNHKRGLYIMCLFDTFGADYTPLALGVRDGDSVRFEFAYDSGPFHTTFQRVPDGYDIHLMGAGKDGKMQPFGVKRLRPAD